MMNKKEGIIKNIYDVLDSIGDNFRVFDKEYGSRDEFPNLYFSRVNKVLNARFAIFPDTHYIKYGSTLYLSKGNKFEMTVCEFKKRFFWLRFGNKFYYKTVISKTDEKHRAIHASSNAVEIIFEYSKNEFVDIQTKIFKYFEDKNYYHLNHTEIKRQEAVNNKITECVDILKNSVGKKIKREKGLGKLLEDNKEK